MIILTGKISEQHRKKDRERKPIRKYKKMEFANGCHKMA